MRLRTSFLLNSIALALLTMFVVLTMSWATGRVERYAAQGALAERIVAQVFELNLLAQSYVAHYEERPRVQWYRVYQQLDETLASRLLEERPSRERIGALRASAHELKTAFDRLVAREALIAENADAGRHLADDLLVKARRVNTEAGLLARRAYEERSRTRAGMDRFVFFQLGLLVIAGAIAQYRLYRKIILPVLRLQKDIAIVGGGDLDHKVAKSAADDELSRMAKAFDAMTAALKLSYDGLEEKVRSRTAELADANRRNELLLESMGDGVVAIDLEWRIMLWNPAAEKITGWSRRQAIGKPFRSVMTLLRERDRSENVLFISEAMLSGQTKSMENHTLLVRKDGTEIPVADSAAPIVGPDKKISGAIVVFRDATVERDSHLVRSSFAYASHQLRTPVNRALWSLEMLRESSPTPEFAKKIGDSVTELRSVHKLVTSLVEVSEVDQGVVIPKVEELQAAEIVAEAVALVSDKAKARGSAVLVAASPKVGSVRTDHRLFLRALYEVVDNAVIYGTPGSEIKVDLSVAGKDLLVTVKNDGVGIPVEQQGVVFTKFFRGENVPPESIGAGMGLYIARRYLELLGGKVWFRSEAGKGAVFSVSVPIGAAKKTA